MAAKSKPASGSRGCDESFPTTWLMPCAVWWPTSAMWDARFRCNSRLSNRRFGWKPGWHEKIRPNANWNKKNRVLQLVHALNKLPEAQREALMLHYWTGWPLVQIATQMGRSREAIAGLLKRGLRQLRIELDVGNQCHDE